MKTAINFSKTAFVVITGASRGIGRQIAVDISNKLCRGSEIVLMARSTEGLKQTATLIKSTNQDKVKVTTETVDFSNFKLEDCEKLFGKLLSEKIKYESGIIFHNVGSIGTLKKVSDMTDVNIWRKYYELNFFSTIVTNNVFMKELSKLVKRIYVINITSLCGRKPFPVMAMYGSGKAARDLYFSVLSIEEPDVVVLKYSPGPVKTDMVQEIVVNAENDELKSQFQGMIEAQTILTPQQTVEKLLFILENGKFKSGDTIDYYDEIN